MMKKIFIVVLSLALCLCAFACEDSKKPIVTVQLNKQEITLTVDEEFTLTPTVANSTESVVWQSDKVAIATVTNGKVLAKAVGTANITATIGDVKDTCVVTVTAKPIPVIEASITEKTLKFNEEYTLGATVSYKNSTVESAISYESDKPLIVSVSSAGVIKGISLGKANITLSTTYKNIKATKIIEVTVAEVVDFTLSAEAADLVVETIAGDSRLTTATIEPTVTVDGKAINAPVITFETSAATVAEVSSIGVITAKGKGVATITAAYMSPLGVTINAEVAVVVSLVQKAIVEKVTCDRTWDLGETASKISDDMYLILPGEISALPKGDIKEFRVGGNNITISGTTYPMIPKTIPAGEHDVELETSSICYTFKLEVTESLKTISNSLMTASGVKVDETFTTGEFEGKKNVIKLNNDPAVASIWTNRFILTEPNLLDKCIYPFFAFDVYQTSDYKIGLYCDTDDAKAITGETFTKNWAKIYNEDGSAGVNASGKWLTIVINTTDARSNNPLCYCFDTDKTAASAYFGNIRFMTRNAHDALYLKNSYGWRLESDNLLGEIGSVTTTYIKQMTIPTAPTAPTTTLTFKFWSEDGATEFDFTKPMTRNVKLGAVYEEKTSYTVNHYVQSMSGYVLESTQTVPDVSIGKKVEIELKTYTGNTFSEEISTNRAVAIPQSGYTFDFYYTQNIATNLNSDILLPWSNNVATVETLKSHNTLANVKKVKRAASGAPGPSNHRALIAQHQLPEKGNMLLFDIAFAEEKATKEIMYWLMPLGGGSSEPFDLELYNKSLNYIQKGDASLKHETWYTAAIKLDASHYPVAGITFSLNDWNWSRSFYVANIRYVPIADFEAATPVISGNYTVEHWVQKSNGYEKKFNETKPFSAISGSIISTPTTTDYPGAKLDTKISTTSLHLDIARPYTLALFYTANNSKAIDNKNVAKISKGNFELTEYPEKFSRNAVLEYSKTAKGAYASRFGIKDAVIPAGESYIVFDIYYDASVTNYALTIWHKYAEGNKYADHNDNKFFDSNNDIIDAANLKAEIWYSVAIPVNKVGTHEETEFLEIASSQEIGAMSMCLANFRSMTKADFDAERKAV